MKESKVFSCTPIITGEIRPQEASTSARVLNFFWSKSEDLSGLTYVQEHVTTMPVIGYHWLRFLATTDLNLVDGFADARSLLMAKFGSKRFTNPGRLATIYTLLWATYNLLCESPLGDVFIEIKDEFVKALDEAIDEQGIMVSEETEVARFIAGVQELIASNPELFLRQHGDKTELKSNVIGKFTNKGVFLLPIETMNELNRRHVFSQHPTEDSLAFLIRFRRGL